MDTLFSIGIGVVVMAAVYLYLSRSLPRMLIGFVLLGAAVNMLILVAGRVGAVMPPVVNPGVSSLAADAANPLPQALILTAIVIGLGLTAFAVALTLRFLTTFGTVDPGRVCEAEFLDTPDSRPSHPDVVKSREAA